MNTKGQVTIFIIIGVLVVAAVLIIFLLVPRLNTGPATDSANPSAFIESCIMGDLEDTIVTLSLQGGQLAPTSYYVFENNNVGYTCYTNEYYKTCIVQQPLLHSQIEKELAEALSDVSDTCFSLLQQQYEDEGYSVSMDLGETQVSLLPKRIVILYNHSLALTKTDTRSIEEISVVLNNNLYELVGIALSITKWESNFGDAQTTPYMDLYRDLKVEKKKQSEGTTIYMLTDRNNGNTFQFATRSVAWPPGLAVGAP